MLQRDGDGRYRPQDITDAHEIVVTRGENGYAMKLDFPTGKVWIEKVYPGSGISDKEITEQRLSIALPSDINALSLKKAVAEFDVSKVVKGFTRTHSAFRAEGSLTPDAQRAVSEFESMIEMCDEVEVRDFDDFDTLDDSDAKRLGVTAQTSDAELEEIQGVFESEMKATGSYYRGVFSALCVLRDQLREQDEEEQE